MRRSIVAGLLLLMPVPNSPSVSITFTDARTIVFRLSDSEVYTGVVDLDERPLQEVRSRAGHLRSTIGSFTYLEFANRKTAHIHLRGKVIDVEQGINFAPTIQSFDTSHSDFECATGEPHQSVVSAGEPTDPCATRPGDPCYEAEQAMLADQASSQQACNANSVSPKSEITAVIVYTKAIRDVYGGTHVLDHIVSTIAETNRAFQVSNIPAHLSFAKSGNNPCIIELPYNEAGDVGKELGFLLKPADGKLDRVQHLRKLCRANVGMLLVETTTMRRTGMTCVMKSLGTRYAPYALGVVHYPSMIQSYVFTHELGHMFGGGHDLDQRCHGGMCPDSAGAHFDFPPGTAWKTMMAYNGERALNFSDPNMKFLGWGPNMGGPNENNARTLRISAQTVSQFSPP